MRPGAPSETVTAVQGEVGAPRRISLEIDGPRSPLHGRVAEADGTCHEFEGWLALLTILGSLVDAPRPATGAPPPPATTPPRQGPRNAHPDH